MSKLFTTPEDIAIQLECNEDFYFFCRYMFYRRKQYKWLQNWHHKLICDKLMDVFNMKVPRLIINIPPRYSKTEIAVINWIAWCLGKVPDAEFIHASYSKKLATKNSFEAKSLVTQPSYKEVFPHVGIAKDSAAKDDWKTTAGGSVYATGSDGLIVTGKHFLI